MVTEEDKLDRPVFYSLQETHAALAIHFEGGSFYQPDFCPFGGRSAISLDQKAVAKYAALTNQFFVVGEQPQFDFPIVLRKELVCLQMVLPSSIKRPLLVKIQPLESLHQKQQLQTLVNSVQPGYFKSKTAEMGRYFGIFKDSYLVAVGGERMKMNAFTEISAIVTHPDHRGNGYAKQLIKHITDLVISEGKTPYLHVIETNKKAIAIYDSLGFKVRRKISFWDLGVKA